MPDRDALQRFAEAVIWQTAHAVVPLLNAAYRERSRLDELDRLADLFLVNTVANRASRVQGRALAATVSRVWPTEVVTAIAARVEAGHGHLAPVMGAMFSALGMPLQTAQHVCLFTAVRGVLAAAVRLGIAGSYDSQRLQHELAPAIAAAAVQARDFDERDLAQAAPIVDVLQAAHDRLYSRLFQS